MNPVVRDLKEFGRWQSSSHLEKSLMLLSLGFQGKKTFDWIQKKRNKRKTNQIYTIKIDRTSTLGVEFLKWAFDFVQEIPKSFFSYTTDKYNSGTGRYDRNYRVTIDRDSTFEFEYEGFTYKVGNPPKNTESKDVETADGETISVSSSSDSKSFYIQCPSLKAYRAINEKLSQIADSFLKTEKRDLLKLITPSASYSAEWHSSYRQKRPLSSVVLADTVKEDLVKDLKDFIASKDEFISRGIPWRRGYLLSGPPGNGKSSLIKALATELDRSIYWLSLSDLSSDSKLLSLTTQIDEGGILVIEDIDGYAVTHERENVSEEERRISLSGILNVLDGPISPDGLITIMTTNHAEVLDKALTRKGRVDVSIEIDNPNFDQFGKMWELFYSEPSSLTEQEFNTIGENMAFYYDVFKTHMYDAQMANIILKERSEQ